MRTHCFFTAVFALLLFWNARSNAQESGDDEDPINARTFSGLSFRSLGPAKTAGRVADLAVNPEDHSNYYVAVASGGVWRTDNGGTTYEPIFDDQGSFSIGCVALDPNNPDVVWVGTGENNNQRSVGYGDGVYRSDDGGKTWKNTGLKESEHIGEIVVDPRDPDVVYVAAYGPLWDSGGDRGLYKTTDGGDNWEKVLGIDKHTGVSDIEMDPRNPDLLYVSSHQRRRRVWTYISGGPGSMVFKTRNGGKSWDTLNTGLPSGDLGRIGLALAPSNPDMIYAIVEASGKKGGFFRSTDRGASWEKRSGYSTSGNYYQEIKVDPRDPDKVYSMNTFGKVTRDGGKSFENIGLENKHVDDHAIWIDPDNTEHYIMGCDGGLYETWDDGENWHFKPNLPITQFYKAEVDNDKPFYNIYGGTQDNNTLGGPSRTVSASGIVNSDWYITKGGDGFEIQVDPKNSDIVYTESQYGVLARYDKQSGETVGIQPQPGENEDAYRWNWDAPLLISPHDNKRLYFAANKVFRSDNRGNEWKTVSGDLTRELDRNKLPVMGRVWSMDAVAKNQSTSIYGNITALSESPLKEGLLYAGTDDGLIQVSENGGESWREIGKFPGVPKRTYCHGIVASKHDSNTVFAVFNNHKSGDFSPYILKSTDKGKTWTSISGDLPDKGSVYTIQQDHQNPELLFCGTEYGVFFSVNGGKEWTQLKSGIPTIAVRDLEIQEREDDLVLASFGRGFYVLDNYAPLRNVTKDSLQKEAHLFGVKDAWEFIESTPEGGEGKAFLGASFYTADNPPLGATFTYYLKEDIKTLKEKRREKEKKKKKKGKDVFYPSFDRMRKEDREESPYLLFTVRDQEGDVVRRLRSKPGKGINRITWDLRYPDRGPVELDRKEPDHPYYRKPKGHLVIPGTYSVTMAKYVRGEITQMTGPRKFEVKALDNRTLPAEDKEALLSFQKEVAELRRAVDGANEYHKELNERVDHLKKAVRETPGEASIEVVEELRSLEDTLHELDVSLNGDRSLAKRHFETKPGISGRVNRVLYNLWNSRSAPTETFKENYRIAGDNFKPVLKGLRSVRDDLKALEEQLESVGAPWTPGRLPEWE